MKKVDLKGKLALKKETITKLNNEQLMGVRAGCGNTGGTMCCGCSGSCDFTISCTSNCSAPSCIC